MFNSGKHTCTIDFAKFLLDLSIHSPSQIVLYSHSYRCLQLRPQNSWLTYVNQKVFDVKFEQYLEINFVRVNEYSTLADILQNRGNMYAGSAFPN